MEAKAYHSWGQGLAKWENREQAGTEQLELGFNLIKACCIVLMIINYHYISLSIIGLNFVTSTYLHSGLLNCYLPYLLAYLLSYRHPYIEDQTVLQ